MSLEQLPGIPTVSREEERSADRSHVDSYFIAGIAGYSVPENLGVDSLLR